MKFDSTDKKIISDRNIFFEKNSFNAKFVTDNWPLFAGTVPMGIFLARYEILKKTIDVPGHILEFGSFNGTNLVYMAKLMQLLSPHNLKKIFGFDSFEGLTEISTEDKLPKGDVGAYKGNKELLNDILELHQLKEIIELEVGYIEKTLPPFLEKNKHFLFSLIYIDTDLYSSTKIILQECWDRLSPKGIIVFDEGYHDRFPGEGQALMEFVKTIEGKYDSGHIPFARQPMLWIQKK
ncbi:MAG TPA: class I SAM-dependent methyltransferase [Bacteroidia bacterium]|nr:class I SAM-dependent methyltransferase [Bacteroidia bacterium]